MINFNVPKKEEVSEKNQAIFDTLETRVGFVPNLYATIAYNDNALEDYLNLQNRKSTLSTKEREVINLVVSQVNDCRYCQSAHTAIGKMNGFTDDQILEIREGSASFDNKLDALARFVKNITVSRTHPNPEVVEALFEAGFTKANLVDIIFVIGDKFISNLLNGVTNIPIDFPEAPVLEPVNG
ncbi:MAG: carboxymuconolactone decarboxylase family protein [Cyclobacteriaceae bacterium]